MAQERQTPPGWVEVVTFGCRVGSTVLHGARGDLTSRRARWAVSGVAVAGGVGAELLSLRYPRPQSADQRLVATAMRDARELGDVDVAELRLDPVFRAAHDRLRRNVAVTVVYGAGVMLGRQVLLAALMRRGVRRPHLITGIAVAALQTAQRVGAVNARWSG